MAKLREPFHLQPAFIQMAKSLYKDKGLARLMEASRQAALDPRAKTRALPDVIGIPPYASPTDLATSSDQARRPLSLIEAFGSCARHMAMHALVLRCTVGIPNNYELELVLERLQSDPLACIEVIPRLKRTIKSNLKVLSTSVINRSVQRGVRLDASTSPTTHSHADMDTPAYRLFWSAVTANTMGKTGEDVGLRQAPGLWMTLLPGRISTALISVDPAQTAFPLEWVYRAKVDACTDASLSSMNDFVYDYLFRSGKSSCVYVYIV